MRPLIRELAETVILALLIFVALQLSVQTYRVEGPSMEPTLEQDQHLFVNKLVYLHIDPADLANRLPFVNIKRKEPLFPFHPPRRGEVIIFRFPVDPSRDFVKRVIGEPGDTVEIQNGQVFVNGEALEEPYLIARSRGSMALRTVAPEFYFVLGDNRPVSDDSRSWGQVPVDNVIGRAWVSYWPLDRIQTLSLLVPGPMIVSSSARAGLRWYEAIVSAAAKVSH